MYLVFFPSISWDCSFMYSYIFEDYSKLNLFLLSYFYMWFTIAQHLSIILDDFLSVASSSVPLINDRAILKRDNREETNVFVLPMVPILFDCQHYPCCSIIYSDNCYFHTRFIHIYLCKKKKSKQTTFISLILKHIYCH